MQIPGVARACCQQSGGAWYTAELGMTAAAATPEGNTALWDFSWRIAYAGGLGFEHMPPYCCSDSRQRVYIAPEKEKKNLGTRMFSHWWTS